MSTLPSSRRERAELETVKATREGLLNARAEASVFKTLGIGEARPTEYMRHKSPNRAGKLAEQWWAPAELVKFNTYMKKLGLSGKMRCKALRLMVEGKDLPGRLSDALASYTEHLLSRG